MVCLYLYFAPHKNYYMFCVCSSMGLLLIFVIVFPMRLAGCVGYSEPYIHSFMHSFDTIQGKCNHYGFDHQNFLCGGGTTKLQNLCFL